MIPHPKFIFSLVLTVWATMVLGQCPEVAFIYADACEAPDGKGEFLVLDNDSLDMPINEFVLTTPSGFEACVGCTVEWQTPNVSSLNTLAGCGTLFVGIGPGDVLPAGKRLIVFTNRNFKDDVDWSNFCDQAPVYVVTIDKVDNTDKYTHNEGSCVSSTAKTYLEYGSAYGCGLDSVGYDPCSMDEETTGSDGGWGIAFADGAATSREVGCELFDVEVTTLDVPKRLREIANVNSDQMTISLQNESWQIQTLSLGEEMRYSLGNMQGQILSKGSLRKEDGLELDLNLPHGMYWLYLVDGKTSRTTKLRIYH